MNTMEDQSSDCMDCEMSAPALPQEIIHQVLSNIPTRQLCLMLSTSRSFYLDVMGILNARLQRKLVDEGDNKLIVISHISANTQRTNQSSSLKPSFRAI